MVAEAPPAVEGNWALASKVWLPISMLPTGGPPVALANVDKSVIWFVDQPNDTPVKHTVHKQDENGKFLFTLDGKQQVPDTEEVVINPEWFCPAVYVDADGKPVT